VKRAAWSVIATLAALAPACAAGDQSLERMATCQDSWFDWQSHDPARLKAFGDSFQAGFTKKDGEPFLVPKTSTSVAGLRVVQVFPDSIGMGVGFSVTVDAPFDVARKNVERIVGKPLGKCETGDSMRSCELDIADKRSVTVMAGDPKGALTLIGCYYFYEK
jgi:hypothetical protein